MGSLKALGSPQILGPASLGSPTSSTLPLPFLLITSKPVGQQLPHWLNPQVYVLKRPHVDEFLQRMGELFECVLFTASLAKVSPFPGSGATLPMVPCALLWDDLPPTLSMQTLSLICWTSGEPSVPGCFENHVSSIAGTM